MPTTITLPDLELPPTKHAVGEIRHVLEVGGPAEVAQINEVRISSRRTAQVYVLSSGDRIVVTDRKLTPPSDVDGVLYVPPEGEARWLWHKRLEQLKDLVAAEGWRAVSRQVTDSWEDAFRFRSELRNKNGEVTKPGLRPPQIGALHAIGAHWSLYREPATIVMPTGTGKTEAMLGALVAYVRGTLLIIVPWRTLRDQTARKLLTLGLLRSLGNITPAARNPVVGILFRRPRTVADLELFAQCNVVIGTTGTLAQGVSHATLGNLAARVDTLFVDEAHHVAAKTWSAFREHFGEHRVMQFTATPFRRDGKLVDGKVVYSYPLKAAQEDGYFKRIVFRPVFEIDAEEGDRAIADAAVAQLRSDLQAGYDHLLLARCENIARAQDMHQLYAGIADDLHPVVVHSELHNAAQIVGDLRQGKSRIVVCVDMLGEGFDLPQLKIAAVHDTHKSLAVILQFTGRFTRVAGANVGDASVIANIANQDVSAALERLYSEDADWNALLSEFSSQAVQQHFALVEFLNASRRLDQPDEKGTAAISHHLLRPKFSTAVYNAPSFQPKKFVDGLAGNTKVHRVWLHEKSETLYFVTATEPAVAWTRSRELTDRQWDLFVLHYDAKRKLLYVHASDKSSLHESLAKAVGAEELVRGDVIFRTLGKINRLVFQNVGVKKHGRRNLRYAMYTGADVADALSISERAGSVKSNLFGGGWEDGKPTTIGCSYKGRIWTRDQGTVPEFLDWCRVVGAKLQDASIDTTKIIDNVLIPEEVTALPVAEVLSVDWPAELLGQSDERIMLKWGDEKEAPLSLFAIESGAKKGANRFGLSVVGQDTSMALELVLGGDRGFEVRHAGGSRLRIAVGRYESPLDEYLSEYPPLLRLMDLSELDGNLIVKPRDVGELTFPKDRLEVWNWSGTDITLESIWKGDQKRDNSIQARAAAQYRDGGFDVVFDDDGAGEAADLICLREDADAIRLALVHCKFSGGATAGERVKDIMEVCSQAVRSAKWKYKFKDLCRHIAGREKRLAKDYRPSRFLVGGLQDVNRYLRVSRFKEVRAEIVIVQPGVSRDGHTQDQQIVLAVAHSFLKQTVDVDLDVICSQ
jgi:superfamily II DNA or RNA helicase